MSELTDELPLYLREAIDGMRGALDAYDGGEITAAELLDALDGWIKRTRAFHEHFE